MKRLTTDNPQDNLQACLNMFYVKDGETWVLGGGPGPEYPDVTPSDYVRQIIRAYIPDMEPTPDDDALSGMLAETLLDGPETMEGVVATLYTAGWVCAELRERLKYYEDLQAAGRLQIRKCAYGTGCVACTHWHRIEGTRRGTCDLRAKRRDKFGRETAGAFEPSQSRRACKDYERRETGTYESNA